MIDTEALTAEERDLRSGLLGAAGSAQLGGPGARAMHPPTPYTVLAAGRRARARRRAGAASLLTAAALSVTVAGAGVGTGAFTLPWLRADGKAAPGTLYASAGTRVGDLINVLDAMQREGQDDALWIYASGPRSVANGTYTEEGSWRPSTDGLPYVDASEASDRVIALRSGSVRDEPGDARSGPRTRLELILNRTEPGHPLAVQGTDDLGALDIGKNARGSWLQVRPSAEDGWLVIGLLPADAGAVQLRVAGTEFLLPLDDTFVLQGQCSNESLSIDGDEQATVTCGDSDVADAPTQVSVRFATRDTAPPVEAITYIDGAGRFVTLGPEALVD